MMRRDEGRGRDEGMSRNKMSEAVSGEGGGGEGGGCEN